MSVQLDRKSRSLARKAIVESETDDDAVLAVSKKLKVDEAAAVAIVKALGVGDPVRVTRARALRKGQLLTAFSAAAKSPQAYEFTRPAPRLVRLKGSLLPSIQRLHEWALEQYTNSRVPERWLKIVRDSISEQRQLETRHHGERELQRAEEILAEIKRERQEIEKLKTQTKLGIGEPLPGH